MQDIFSRIEHSRTCDEAALQIEQLLLEGVLTSGDRLPAERDLAARLSVSRPILRDALRGLEERGLIVAHHGGGTYVADVVGEIFSPAMAELIRRHRNATADYMEYRREMESVAADLAARRRTEADCQLLREIVGRMKEAHGANSFEAEAAADVEFHNAISECTHNIVLLHTLRSCYRLLADDVFYNRALIYNLPGTRDRLLEQHVAIFEAIVAGDTKAARQAAAAHIDFVEQAAGDVERANERQRISRLRLQQRAAAAKGKSKIRARGTVRTNSGALDA